MILPDVNVLLYAHRREYDEHRRYVAWLGQCVNAPEPFAMSELVSSAFVRIATNGRAFDRPTSVEDAFEFVARLTGRANCVMLRPGPRNWSIFKGLCEQAHVTSKLVADAYHAALAIEHGCEWITNDGDFARFKTLRWRHPLR